MSNPLRVALRVAVRVVHVAVPFVCVCVACVRLAPVPVCACVEARVRVLSEHVSVMRLVPVCAPYDVRVRWGAGLSEPFTPARTHAHLYPPKTHTCICA